MPDIDNKMNLRLLQKIAKLGGLGYVPTVEIPVVVATTNAHEDSISHLRPRTVLVDENGTSYVDATILHEIEQDLGALIAACGIKLDGRPLHDLVPFAAARVGMMDEFYTANYVEPESEETPEEEIPEDANTD